MSRKSGYSHCDSDVDRVRHADPEADLCDACTIQGGLLGKPAAQGNPQSHRPHSSKLKNYVSSPKVCCLVPRKSGYSHSDIDVDCVRHADPEADNMMLAKFRAGDSAGLLLRVAPKHIDLTHTSS